MTAAQMHTTRPVTTCDSGNIHVTLHRNADNYRFTVTVQGSQMSLNYRRLPDATLRFTASEGNAELLQQLSMRQFHEVEHCVWQCMRETTHDESAMRATSTAAPAELA